MKKIPGCRWVALFAFVLGSTSARAQDAAVVAKNHYRVLVDNAFVRVVENTLKPGEKDPMHTHPAGWFYVTQPGTMKVVHENGRVEMWEAKAGKQGWSDAEGPHTSENVGKTTMGFVLVEVKSAASLPPRR
ncbi:MAG: cupin domain-containing protein [Acidobacteriota bacterium]